MRGITVPVELGARAYPVRIEADYGHLAFALAGLTPGGRAVIVADAAVLPLWGEPVARACFAAGLEPRVVSVVCGEARKTLETWATVVDQILAGPVDRETPVLALGGGVIGDLVGFAAASVLRGLPFVQLPTSLLAMVDSSVGGKTAVNHARGKNLIGAFYQPALVYAAMATLGTLPAAEVRSGLGEIVKTALIADPALFVRLEAEAAGLTSGERLAPFVARCVAIKAGIVAADEREGGRRMILNAGHTLGHGWEAAAGYGALRHGEAVGIGLVAEARFAVALGVCLDTALPERIARLLRALGLPDAPPPVDADAFRAAVGVDKKARGDIIRVPLPVRLGDVSLVDVPASRLLDWATRT